MPGEDDEENENEEPSANQDLDKAEDEDELVEEGFSPSQKAITLAITA